MAINVVTATFGDLRKATTPPVNYQYDTVQKLKIDGLELPDYYGVDFCNDGDPDTMTLVGTAAGVAIPDEYLLDGRDIKAYIVITEGDSVQTRYEITIPVIRRPGRTDMEPTPAEQQQIDSLIEALNDAVEDAEAVAALLVGGNTGQILRKNSDDDRDFSWSDEEKEIFWAEYGTTTYTEIEAAMSANKLVVCLKDGIPFVLASIFGSTFSTEYYFGGNYTAKRTNELHSIHYLKLARANGSWTEGYIQIPEPGGALPRMDGVASAGTDGQHRYSLVDHVHPSDTTKADAAAVGVLAELDTSAKNNLVEAINELVHAPGPAGPGVPSGGATGQVLKKRSGADYDTEWEDSVIERGTGEYSAVFDFPDKPASATGKHAVAVGPSTVASGQNAFAAGYQSIASGHSAVAMGAKMPNEDPNTATGQGAVAIGGSNLASGNEAVALGAANESSGNYSFTAGVYNEASGQSSVAMGRSLIATGRASAVFGQANEADASAVDDLHGIGSRELLMIVGNGTDDNNRSNAMTMDWDGNAVLAGKLTVGAAPVNDMDVATKKYVDDNAGGGGSSITVDSALSDSSENPVQNKVVKAAIDGKGTYSKPSGGIPSSDLDSAVQTSLAKADSALQSVSGTYRTAAAQDTIDDGKADKVSVVTVADAGAVTQALDANKVFDFTGALTSLTITLNAAAAPAHYHFRFDSGSTAVSLTLPNAVVMPSGFQVKASKHYEIDILDGYGVAQSW